MYAKNLVDYVGICMSYCNWYVLSGLIGLTVLNGKWFSSIDVKDLTVKRLCVINSEEI